MFNRRKFLTGLVAGPAAALAGQALLPSAHGPRKVWVIVGVNWDYDDEFNYAHGDSLTEYAFGDRESADKRCADLIGEFCAAEDPDEFLPGEVARPMEWEDWSDAQKWDWLLARTPEPVAPPDLTDNGYGWVVMPFAVREMVIPSSAALHQLDVGGPDR
jgi:hypothetical protein